MIESKEEQYDIKSKILQAEYDIKDVIDNIKFSKIAESKIHGKGLFATQKIKKNTKLGYLDGQVVSWKFHKKYQNEVEWNALDEETLMVRSYRTKYSFINHSKTPNLEIKYFPLRIETIEDIEPNEELTLDYRKEKLPLEYIEKKGKHYL